MKVIGQIVASIFLAILGMGSLLAVQWLGWYGPQFLMMPAHGELILSPLIAVPLLAIAVICTVGIACIWGN